MIERFRAGIYQGRPNERKLLKLIKSTPNFSTNQVEGGRNPESSLVTTTMNAPAPRFEFQKLDGEIPYDIIIKNTDNDLAKLELDWYWVVKAGLDPSDLFRKNPRGFPLRHVKDMEKGPEKSFAEVGTGSIDFKKIFDARKLAGRTHFL